MVIGDRLNPVSVKFRKNELKNAAFKVTFFNSNSEKFYKKGI